MSDTAAPAVTSSPRPTVAPDGTRLDGRRPVIMPPKDIPAAGAKAVTKSFRHIALETGVTRGAMLLANVNQEGGFDCPGCAWPEPATHRSRGEFCENGAKAVAHEATKRTVGPAFFAEHSIDTLLAWDDYALEQTGRLTHPMVREPGASHYTPITWDDAFARIGKALSGLSSPNEAIFYTSGRTSNEAAFMYQLLARSFGTNNLPDCSNMCHESSGRGLGEAIGIGKGCVTLEDFNASDVILVMGQNPGTNHPRMLTALAEARKNGAHIVSINPLPEPALKAFGHPQTYAGLKGGGDPIANVHLPVRVGGDVALLKAVMQRLFERDARGEQSGFDHAFIAEHTADFDAFKNDVMSAPLDTLLEQCGIALTDVDALADVLAASRGTIVCWAMGLTQHKNGVANIQMVMNLLLLGGHIGKPGAGPCPVRGHSNVQGDRTMGIWEAPPERLLAALDARFGITSPRAHGHDAVGAIAAMQDKSAKVFIAMGGNFVSATPDTAAVRAGLAGLDLTVQVSTKLNRSHLCTGKTALILPCLGRTDRDVQKSGPQFVTVENSMSVVSRSQGKVTPAAPTLRSEPAIIAGMAAATLGATTPVDWHGLVENYDVVRDHIAAVIPGFDAYNARVRAPGGFTLPRPPMQRVWNTPSGKANFIVHGLPDLSLADDELMMMTVRSHDQYNTTIYGLDDRYRGVYGGRRVVFMHAEDVAARGLKKGDLVDLTSTYDGVVREAPAFYVVPFDVPRRTAVTYFPEANPLVPASAFADKSRTPISKSVRIRVVPVIANERG